eukprot:5515583-Pyramimonas_sp.AAC.1
MLSACRRHESGGRPLGLDSLPGGISVSLFYQVLAQLVPSSWFRTSALPAMRNSGSTGGIILMSAYFEVGQWANGNASRLFVISLALRGWNRPFA